MAEESLVETQIKETMSLVARLDHEGNSPQKVVWNYFPDSAAWRLLLAGRAFDKLLPKQEALAYEKVSEAIQHEGLSSLKIGNVMIVRSEYPLLQAVSIMIGTNADALVQARMTDNYVNGIFIKDMLVIRSAQKN